MKMDTKKIAAMFALLVIVLGVAGFAYAHWEKIVTVNGKVTTGIVDLIIINAVDSDNGIDPDYTKDVADTVITIDPLDPEIANVTITNAYPSYHVYWHITVRNVGTIPVKLYAIQVDNANPCLTVQAWDGLGEQLDPYSWGGEQYLYQHDYSGYIHVEECAIPETTYTFQVRFVFWNWNEVPTPC
jgi:hypothetical protein